MRNKPNKNRASVILANPSYSKVQLIKGEKTNAPLMFFPQHRIICTPCSALHEVTLWCLVVNQHDMFTVGSVHLIKKAWCVSGVYLWGLKYA